MDRSAPTYRSPGAGLGRRAATAGALSAAAITALPVEAFARTSGATTSVAERTDRDNTTRHGRKKILPRHDRHIASRFSYGVTPKLAKQVRKAGGGEAWFENQVDKARRKDRKVKKLKAWWPHLSYGPAALWDRQVAMVEHGGTVMRSYERFVLMRRITSKLQVLEVMTEFWENYFNVAAVGDQQFTWRVDYGMTIRKNAMGTFEDLLRKAVLHPAMLIYLNASESTKEHPNENLGRELLELHTVGVGNYTEDDVVNSARILTGWSVDLYKTWEPEYNKGDHWVGRVQVGDFKSRNKKAKGTKVTKKYLKYLAHHPHTAERIAERLVLKFVGDGPNRSLVRHLKHVYLRNDTAILPVLRELLASKQFRRSVGEKLRDPGEDVVATYRALGVKVAPPVGPEGDGTAISFLLEQADLIGVMPFDWGSPDGQPITNTAWSSAGRALGSLQVHWGVASRTWPRTGATWPDPASWLPKAQVPFGEFVDDVAQQVMGRHVPASLLQACCTTTGIAADSPFDVSVKFFDTQVARVLAVLLDSPQFMSR